MQDRVKLLLLWSCLSLCFSEFAYAADQVVWATATNASVSSNSLSKTDSSSSWNAGASSTNLIRDGYGFMEFTATETNKMRIVGLSNGDSNQDYTDIDYGILIRNDGSVAIYEGGTFRGEFSTYSANDKFREEVRYGVVKYYKNGSLFYTSTVIPKYPLRVDASIYHQSGTVTDVVIGNLVWTDGSNVTVSRDNLTKSGSTGWTSGAISTNTIESDDGFMEFTATETNTSRIAGLANGNTDQGLNDIEFGLELRDDGVMEVFESGTSRGTQGSYSANDRIRVEVVGGVVRYYVNGSLMYTSGVTPSYPLKADSSLYSVGATLTNVVVESIVWTNVSNVTANGATLTKTGSDGWSAGASSTRAIESGDGWVEFTTTETNKRRVIGLKGSGAASSYSDIEFAIDANASGTIEVFESGTSRGTYGSYTSGDRLRIEIQDGIVRYRKNSSVLYTSSVLPSLPLHMEVAIYSSGGTVTDPAVGDFVWGSEVGVQVIGNTLAKSASGSSSDSAAFSTKAIDTGYFEFTAFETNANRVAGLSHGNTDQNYTDVDFGIIIRTDNSVGVYESGTYRGDQGTYVAGDRFKVEVISSVVKYYKNGSLLYTSTVTPSLPLQVDLSLSHTKGTVFNPILSGDAVLVQLDAPAISPGTGTYNSNQTVTITQNTSGSTIRYTTDGTTPTQSSTVYSSALTISQSQTLKAKAWRVNYSESSTTTATFTMKAATPSFTSGAGTYNTTQSVTLSSTSGATIRYTTDGSTPTTSSNQYTSAVSVDQSQTLKAKAYLSGWTDSDQGSAVYTMKVGTPSFSVTAGSYSSAQSVTLSTTTSSATLRYTTDGNNPTSSSPAVTGAISVGHSETLKVTGYRTGWTTSDQNEATYMITLGTVSTPTFSPSAGTFTANQAVTISSSTSGATIRYTTDGTDPTVRSSIYSSAVFVDRTTALKAKAFKGDYTASGVASGLFVIDTGAVDTPRLSPGSGIYPTAQSVTVTTETSGATIHYTTNGTEPTESDSTVSSGGTLTVEKSKSLRVKAWKSGVTASSVGGGDYHITGAVALGGSFTIALKGDGKVWSWGGNGSGQLGLGSTGGTHTTPSEITSTSGFVAISAGSNHVLAIKGDGTAWAWGSNSNGQIGDGTTTTRTTPVQVSTLTSVIAVSAAQYHSLALKSDGTVWEWGHDSLTNYGTTPVQVAGLKGITVIGAKRNHSFALQKDGEQTGSLWVWGFDDLGYDTSGALSSLGAGTSASHASPVQVAGMTDVVDFSASWYHAFARKSDGSIWGWGQNNLGQLGNGGVSGSNVPTVSVAPLGVVDTIMSLGAGGENSALARRQRTSPETEVWTWGYNGNGSLGVTTANNINVSPVRSLMSGAYAAITGESDHVAAMHIDGGVWMWGYNPSGQLGDGTTTNRTTPAAISGFSLVDNSWAETDEDGDGLPAWLEIEIGADPASVDTNGDGIRDSAALDSGVTVTNLDVDGDGVSNAKERELGADPFHADTDGDGTDDGEDCFPLDSSRDECPAPNPSDTTPPNITLTRPTNATLTGSTP